MDESVKQYMAKIGALGGAAGKGTKLRSRLNKRAAKIRWAKVRGNQYDARLHKMNISPNKSPMK